MKLDDILFCLFAATAAMLPCHAAEIEIRLQDDKETILGPVEPAQRQAWGKAMQAWREFEKKRIGFDAGEYARPELRWAQSSFVQPQAMVEDRYFYDPVSARYTVDRYLDDLQERYGGIDAVLLWAIYPNNGIDNRNQHDMLRAMPGGLPALKKVVQEFHQRGVKVFFPVMPWDKGTREEGLSLEQAIARDLKEIGADGINGDTLNGMGREYRQASDDSGHVVALQPENPLSDQSMLSWNTMSWGYWHYKPTPVVSRYKWVEPRHMVNISERWAHDRTDGLQSAFFNGTGYESWENVWGIWNGFTPRDAHALRRMALIQRATADLLVSPEWQPHVATEMAGVYASLFPAAGQRLWLMVNRSANNHDNTQLSLEPSPGQRYYDLWNGAELKPVMFNGKARLSFEIESRGFGAVLAIDDAHRPAYLDKLLASAAELARTRLGSLSAQWKPLAQQMVAIAATAPAQEAPKGMVKIPAASFRFKVSGVEIEGDDNPGVDVQYPWEDMPRRHHDHVLEVKSFYMDRTPVTNAQYQEFVKASGYRPTDSFNYLRDWVDGAPRAGWGNKPVTWVSLEDARAYAAFVGKRLPHEWEWQYAAQGTDERVYPWGNAAQDDRIPKREDGHELRGPDEVDAHPLGASPFGVLDMVGNVWQWTDEFADTHTRAAVLRGGSYYQPKGAFWYFPQNKTLSEHGKLLLMAPSKDRSGTVGFRCVVDAK